MSKFILDEGVSRRRPAPDIPEVMLRWLLVKLYLMECVAILGSREVPTDGVQDFCCYLRDALANEGVNLTLTQVRWAGMDARPAGGNCLQLSVVSKILFSSAIHGAVVVAARICAARCGHSEIIKKEWRTMRSCISRSRWLRRGPGNGSF